MAEPISDTTIFAKRLAAARAVLRGEAVAAKEIGIMNINAYNGVPSGANTPLIMFTCLERWP